MKTTTQHQSMAEAIQAAYINSITEGTGSPTAKFKVGTKVGIGRYSGDGHYNGIDTGTVTKVSKNGEHEVTHDNQEVAGDPYDVSKVVKRVRRFNAAGYSVLGGDDKQIIDHDQHVANVKQEEDDMIRTNDLNTVVRHIQGKSDMRGNYKPLDRAHAEHLKALIDKHVKE